MRSGGLIVCVHTLLNLKSETMIMGSIPAGGHPCYKQTQAAMAVLSTSPGMKSFPLERGAQSFCRGETAALATPFEALVCIMACKSHSSIFT